MSDYVPTTAEVRAVWREWSCYGGLTDRPDYEGGSRDELVAEFDRWMQVHDREVISRVLREVVALFADELGSAGSSILLGHADVIEKGEVDV